MVIRRSRSTSPATKVRRGQVLALLGNSGNSDAPHVHFGIEDGPFPIASDGVPFVFSSFTTPGAVTNSFERLPPGRLPRLEVRELVPTTTRASSITLPDLLLPTRGT